jgi:hypothetical protein
MSFADFSCSPMSGWSGIAGEFAAFVGDADTFGTGYHHGEPGDSHVASWENAWIDLGGEG